MDVSIIIVNYNTSTLINNCLTSILNETPTIEYEVVIVDNNTELLSDAIINPGIKNLKYIQLSENLGFGRANNRGLTVAKGRNILFLNPDTIILNNAIKVLSDYLDSNPNCGACGANLYDENLESTRSYGISYPSTIKYLLGPLYSLITNRNSRFNHTQTPLDVAYIVGADLMVRKSILNEVGAFDPDFFMYFEEIELCFRIKKASYKIHNVPAAKIQHLEGKSGNVSERIARQHYESSSLFFKKRYGKIRFLINRLLMPLIISSHVIMAKSLKNQSRIRYWKVWNECHKKKG